MVKLLHSSLKTDNRQSQSEVLFKLYPNLNNIKL